MTLVEKMTQWNGGELRGAGARLSRETGAAPNLVSMWMSGTMPGEKYLARVCKALNVTKEELSSLIKETRRSSEIGGANVVRDGSERESGYNFLEIPYLGVVRADRFAFSFDIPPENFTTLAIKGKAGDRYAMLRISGDCMAPRIEDGDEVLVRETSEVPDGSIAIVCFDSECTMKRIYRKKDGLQLKADNPKYEPKTYTSNKVRILAEVVKIMKDPRRKP